MFLLIGVVFVFLSTGLCVLVVLFVMVCLLLRCGRLLCRAVCVGGGGVRWGESVTTYLDGGFP